MNPKECFNNLLHHLTYELVEECLSKIPKSSGVGVDGMTVEQARENLSWLLPPILKQIHEGKYEPPAVRRVYIPKTNGQLRPIGVPAVLDRAIQAAMTRILNEIYEQDFLKCSFGFRPGLGCHHALATVNEQLHHWKSEHVLVVDIQNFFGSLSHEWLMKFLKLRVGEPRVLRLIESWLRAGVLEDGEWHKMEQGTPQGGSISPLLGNLFLHYVLDLWFERKIKPKFFGKANLVHTLVKARLAQFGEIRRLMSVDE
jgi:group II intron reverse transcriptase/maturase